MIGMAVFLTLAVAVCVFSLGLFVGEWERARLVGELLELRRLNREQARSLELYQRAHLAPPRPRQVLAFPGGDRAPLGGCDCEWCAEGRRQGYRDEPGHVLSRHFPPLPPALLRQYATPGESSPPPSTRPA
jgi:hypothetical protein